MTNTAVNVLKTCERVPRRIRYLVLSLVLFGLYALLFCHADAYYVPHPVDAVVIAKAPVEKKSSGTASYRVVVQLPDGSERDVELNDAAAHASMAAGSKFSIEMSDASLGRPVPGTAILQRIAMKLLMVGGMVFGYLAMRRQ